MIRTFKNNWLLTITVPTNSLLFCLGSSQLLLISCTISKSGVVRVVKDSLISLGGIEIVILRHIRLLETTFSLRPGKSSPVGRINSQFNLLKSFIKGRFIEFLFTLYFHLHRHILYLIQILIFLEKSPKIKIRSTLLSLHFQEILH